MHILGLLLRAAGIGLGVALILIGLPLAVTPIPIGAILIALGAIVLVASSTQAQAWVRRRRERNPRFDARMRRWEAATPRLFRAILTSTRPTAAK